MKKNFITPKINIDLFMTEDVITTSGNAETAANQAAKSFGGTVTSVFTAKKVTI